MARKPRSRRSLEKEIGLIGLAGFLIGSLLIIPAIVAILYAVAYAPFGVALLVFVGFLTRRRWVPGLRARLRPVFAPTTKVSHPRERGGLRPEGVTIEATPRERRTPQSVDLRDV